jgi:phosphate transport system substrate-binding protein
MNLNEKISSVRKSRQRFVGLVAALLLVGFQQSTAPTSAGVEVLSVSGSGTTTAILSGVVEAFESDNPGYRLSVLPGAGTGSGVQGILSGGLDLAAMARAPKDSEAEQGVEWVQFGFSAGPVLAHPDVGVNNLTTEQVVAVFSGEVTNWSEVGGADVPIVLFVRDEEDSSTQSIRGEIIGDMPFPASAEILVSQSEMQEKVSGTPGAVGFGSLPAALAAGADLVGLALDGISPTDPDFPIVSPIGVGFMSEYKADFQILLDWLLSDQGQQALGNVGVTLLP